MTKAPKKSDLTLPEYVHPLGIRFQVRLVDQVDEEGSAGETDGDKRTIKIAQFQDKKRRWSTLLHEYIHATFVVNGIGSIGDEDLEEIVVQSLEHSIEQFMMAHGDKYLAALAVQKIDEE